MTSSPADRSLSICSRVSAVLLTLVIVWGAAPAAAQTPITFGTSTSYPTGSGSEFPGFMTAADFNDDGNLDLIVTDGARMRLLMASGPGTFFGPVTLNVSGPCPGPACVIQSNKVIPVDVTGDGKLDLVTSNNHSRNLSVIAGNGDGTFQAPTNYAMGWDTRTVALGDLNKDGRLDMVGGDSNGELRIFLGTGGGAFAPAGSMTDGAINRQDMAIVDMDKDGNLDVIVGNRDTGDISWLRGNGTGALIPAARYAGARGDTLIVEDLNSDGWLDVVAPGQSLQHIVVLMGTPGGALAAPVSYPTGGLFSLWLKGADLDGDGDLDVVVSNQNSHNVSILAGDGQSGFGVPTVMPNPINHQVLSMPIMPVLEDFDHDGKFDLAVVSSNQRRVAVWLNTTAPSDTTPPAVTATVSGTLGSGGWYTSDVTVSWAVSDPETAVTTSGCDAQTVSSDTNGVTITCTATSTGGTTSESVTIKRDTTAPAISSATANPGSLWPPNNKMRAVTVSANATDAGAGVGVCTITGVADNEGTSAHEPDVEITGALTLNLRAERSGNGSGRVYGVQIACRDAAGNTSTATATVVVPHDQGKK